MFNARLFIIEGTASFAIALGCMFILPDFPHSKTGSTRWLFTEAERELAVERLSRDRVSEREADHSVMHGLKLAVIDYRTWVFVSPTYPISPSISILTCTSRL